MTQHYYGPHAYNPATIPDQPAEPHRSWLAKLGKIRLPWGHPSDCAPANTLTFEDQKMLQDYNATPESERKIGKTFADQYGAAFDQECYREPAFSLRLRIIVWIYSIGRIGSIICVPLTLFVMLASLYKLGDRFWESMEETYQFIGIFCGIPLTIWLISYLLVKLFTNFFFFANKGAKWEINRRSGEVIFYQYQGKKHTGTLKYPFYQFDAYLNGIPSRQGIMQYRIYLVHRYTQHYISLEQFESLSYSFEPLFAVWDFLQNYMDTSKPLPDIPVLEKFRHLDPVTAAYDKQTGRASNYWATMDKATFKQKIKENAQLMANSTMSTRFDIMVPHVEYRF